MANRKRARVNFQMWAIYERPSDAPQHFVVRRWEIVGDQPEPREASKHDSLEEARAAVPRGLQHINRYPNDDPKIVETWI